METDAMSQEQEVRNTQQPITVTWNEGGSVVLGKSGGEAPGPEEGKEDIPVELPDTEAPDSPIHQLTDSPILGE